jgi:hypothetical protein
VVRGLEQAARDIHTLVQRVHRPGGVRDTAGIGAQARVKFLAVQVRVVVVAGFTQVLQELYGQLDGKLPANSFWRYCQVRSPPGLPPTTTGQVWSTTTAWVAFLASLTVYLETETLATRQQVVELLGLGATNTVKLDVEEYLLGLCHLSNELVSRSNNWQWSESSLTVPAER